MAQHKVPPERETEFRMAWQNLRLTVSQVALRFECSSASAYVTARRLGLPARMPMLRELCLPPFGPRKRKEAA